MESSRTTPPTPLPVPSHAQIPHSCNPNKKQASTNLESPTSRMTVSEKVEQAFTHRPNSLVPGRTLERLFGLPRLPDSQMQGRNLAMHYGQGALVGGVRGLFALYGVRGPFADFMFMCVRLCVDQSLENIAGTSAPPW